MNRRFLWAGATIAIIIIAILFRSCKGASVRVVEKYKESGAQTELLNSAKEFEDKADLLSAKDIYKKLILEFPDSEQASKWQKKIEEYNMRTLVSPVLTEDSVHYQVKPGDSLYRIAKEFNTTTELIMRANNLKSAAIFPGKKLKVQTKPFNIIVNKSKNILILRLGPEVIKTYTVSTGMNRRTPVGNFKIKNKLIDPTWFKEGRAIPAQSPENILGTRWLGFNLDDYGIHGTNDPSTLGQYVTQGCVRMANRDVEELYMIVPVETEVTIEE